MAQGGKKKKMRLAVTRWKTRFKNGLLVAHKAAEGGGDKRRSLSARRLKKPSNPEEAKNNRDQQKQPTPGWGKKRTG